MGQRDRDKPRQGFVASTCFVVGRSTGLSEVLSPFFEIARVLVRLDHFARFIINADHGLVVKYWEIIADNLSKAGWSWCCVSAVDCEGRTIWIADAHRGD